MSDPTALPHFPAPPAPPTLRPRVVEQLEALGLAPEVDGDGDVAITVRVGDPADPTIDEASAQQRVFVRCVEADLPSLRVFGQWLLAPEVRADPDHVAEATSSVNLGVPFAKAAVDGESLYCLSEHLAPAEGEMLSATLQVAISAVLSAVHLWHQIAMGIDPQTLASPDPSSNGSAS